MSTQIAPDEQGRALRRGVRLQWATITWNVMEVVVTIWLGIQAESFALIAFGLDSLVEVFASLTVLWYMADREAVGRVAHSLRLVAVAFATLGIALLISGTAILLAGNEPDSSPVGIAYTGATAVVMFTLAWLKRRTGSAAKSAPLQAEASMTFLDGCLASGILLALAMNSAFGWWWADPAAALLVALFCFRSAWDTWHEASASSTAHN